MIIGTAVFFGVQIAGQITRIFGVKKTMMSGMTLAMIAAVLLAVFLDVSWLGYPSLLLAKFGMTSTFNSSYLANVSLFPPYLVGSVFALTNFVSRCSTLIAP